MLSRLFSSSRASSRILVNTVKPITPTTYASSSAFSFDCYHQPSTPFRIPSPRYASNTPMAAPTDTQADAVQSSTGITPDSLAQTLREKLEATHVDIQDISGGCGASFEAVIVSPLFQGKTLLARGRLVNSALKQEIAAIHAWTPRCLTPEQWEKMKGSS